MTPPHALSPEDNNRLFVARPAGGVAVVDRRQIRRWIASITAAVADRLSWREDAPEDEPGGAARAQVNELERENAALRAELGQRQAAEAALVSAKDAAEAAAQAKSALLAEMSHEIRTPMNGVLGMANLLLESPLDAEQRELAETVCRSGEALLKILNDILDFSKLEAGRLKLERLDFDLAEQLRLALDLQADEAARKGLELILDLDPSVPRHVCGDPGRLRQIVLNLVGNAVKFTAAGEVVVRARVASEAAGGVRLRFEVIDTGAGIPRGVLGSLFQEFVQAEASTARRFGGTGLGLAICRRLVALMGGEIGASSVEGFGSTFWFELGLGAVAAPPEPRSVPGALPEDCRVLIVDDNATNRKLLARLCSGWGVRHGVAATAATALAQLQWAAQTGQEFDLVILDQHLPDVDGLSLADEIQADELIRPSSVVLLTSRSERLTASEMTAHGIAACELKPVYADQLHATLARVLAATRRPANGVTLAGKTGEPATMARPSAAILIVDDDPVSRKVLGLQLRNLGYRVAIANDGREALAALRERPYGAVLMDAGTEGTERIEALQMIRAAQAANHPGIPHHLPLIAVAAGATAADRAACLEAGLHDCLPKPARAGAIATMLRRHLAAAPGRARA